MWGSQMCAALNLAQRGFCLQLLVSGECYCQEPKCLEPGTGCSATDGPSISIHGPVNISEDWRESWRVERRAEKRCLLDRKSQTHPTHSRCSCLHKNCTRSGQPKFQHGWGGPIEPPCLDKELLAGDGWWGREISFLWGGGSTNWTQETIIIIIMIIGKNTAYAHVVSINWTQETINYYYYYIFIIILSD